MEERCRTLRCKESYGGSSDAGEFWSRGSEAIAKAAKVVLVAIGDGAQQMRACGARVVHMRPTSTSKKAQMMNL